MQEKSSSRPNHLERYANVACGLNQDISVSAQGLHSKLLHFEDTCRERNFAIPVQHLAVRVQEYSRQCTPIDNWVFEVSKRFVLADTGSLDGASGDRTTIDGVVDKSDKSFWEKIADFQLPFWIEVGLGIIPFTDLFDIVRESVKGLTGQEVDELVLTFAVAGLLLDAGWISPEPLTEAANGVVSLAKVLMKRLPRGSARDAIAETFKKAFKNITSNPDEIKRLAEVGQRLMKNEELFEKLIKNPEVLAVMLRQGPEFIDLLTKYGDDAFRVVGEYGDDGVKHLFDYDKVAKYLPALSKQSLPIKLPKLDPKHGYDKVDWSHLLEGHSWDYLKPIDRASSKSVKDLSQPTSMWPKGTSVDDIHRYLEETLNKLDDAKIKIKPGKPQSVTLDNGFVVQIGVWDDSKTIGQFFPKDGPGVVHISAEEIKILADLPDLGIQIP